MRTIGDGNLMAVESKYMTLSDTTMPTLAVSYAGIRQTAGDLPTDQVNGASITIDADGATTAPTIVIKFKSRDFDGDDAADVSWTISGGATKAAWSSRAATAVTLKDVVDLLNEIPGIHAHAMHAPFSMSVNSTNFIDLTETPLNSGANPGSSYTECLYRDASEFVNGDSDKVAYMRVGLPDLRDGNAFDLVDIMGSATGVTNGTLKVYSDRYGDYGETAETYVYETLAASEDSYLGTNKKEAMTVRGPVIVEAASDDISACKLWVKIIQRQIGA